MKRPNFFAASPLNRAAHLRRNEEWLKAQLGHARSRFLVVWNDRSLLTQTEEGPRALFLEGEAVAGLLEEPSAHPVFLGVQDDVGYFVLAIGGDEAPLGALGLRDGAADFHDIRFMGAAIPGDEAAILAHAKGLAYWHSRHLFCGVCGAATRSGEAGHVRVCTNSACNAQHFPRTDPAVIMLVTDGDTCLLGRQESWPEGMYSTLAGFVEPGESLEEAVAREVFEEAGIGVSNVRYHSSQPWPFPSSIMLGFYAEADSTELKLDRSEIQQAGWFSREVIRAQEVLRMPPPTSIARRMIDDWLSGYEP